MNSDGAKRAAAAAALKLVEPGMTLGLGTGSTAAHFIDLLGASVRAGLDVAGVPTSEDTRAKAEAAGVALIEPDETTIIDLAIDGADEVDLRLDLIKGGGGALLREKIVASAARRFVVIADAGKRVAELGKFPLPVEIEPFAFGLTARAIRELLAAHDLPSTIALRSGREGAPFLTDGGNYILDCKLQRIREPRRLEESLSAIAGVVGTGLFIGLADVVILGGPNGVETLRRAG